MILGQAFMGEKYVTQKERKKKNNPKNIGHFVPLQSPRAMNTLGSDQLDSSVATLQIRVWTVQ